MDVKKSKVLKFEEFDLISSFGEEKHWLPFKKHFRFLWKGLDLQPTVLWEKIGYLAVRRLLGPRTVFAKISLVDYYIFTSVDHRAFRIILEFLLVCACRMMRGVVTFT